MAAFTEAVARLVSLALRSGVDPAEVAGQLVGIGGSRSVGFGPGKVRSVPDAIGKALFEALGEDNAGPLPPPKDPAQEELPLSRESPRGAEICPECGAAAFVRLEGCQKCIACGHSEC